MFENTENKKKYEGKWHMNGCIDTYRRGGDWQQ